MGTISAKRNLAIWRQSGLDACCHRNKSHGLTLPRLPALLFHCPSLSFIIFISSYNQCEILSEIDSSVSLLIPTLSCLGVKVWALNCLTVENYRGKRSKIPIALAMSSFVFERTMVIAHVLFHILKDAASVPCFSAVLQHYEGQEIRQSFEDELKRTTGEFEVSIFVLQCHMIFLVSQFRQATLRGLWKISMNFSRNSGLNSESLLRSLQ